MKQLRVPLILGLVFLALLAALLIPPLLPSPPAPTPSPAANVPGTPIYDWQPQDIMALVIDVRGVAPLELQQTEGVWVSPRAQALFDQTLALDVARTLADLPSLSVLDDVPPERYAEFGLSTEGLLMFIQIIMQDGTPHAIVIGNRTPDDQGYYALVDDRPEVFVALRGAVEYLAFVAREAEQVGR